MSTQYKRVLVFKRTYEEGEVRPVWVDDGHAEVNEVYPFETDDDKVNLVWQMTNDAMYFRMFVQGFGLGNY